MGPAKWAVWKDGKLTLGDLVGRRRNREWGTMRYERSLVDVLGAEQAKGYTRLALLGLAKERLNADELIKVAGLGLRELTPAELKRVMEQAARAGFDSKATSIVRSSDMMGILWKGKPIQSGDDLPAGEWHFVKHVLARQEWPDGTEIDEYLESLKGIVRDPKSGIMISKYQDKYWQMTFIGESSIYRGPGGNDFILVEYRVDYGHWVTGFQPASLEEQLTRYRKNIQWLRQLKH